jgi:hypothetical protein
MIDKIIFSNKKKIHNEFFLAINKRYKTSNFYFYFILVVELPESPLKISDIVTTHKILKG